MVSLHGSVPVHAPDQPANVDCGPAVAVRVVCADGEYWNEHAVPQSMWPSAEVTAPVPLPASATTSESSSPNDACTVVSAVAVNVHAPVPVQPSPVQPRNVDPAAGAAVSVTTVPGANEPMHVVPQSMPAGCEVTTPAPLPEVAIVIVTGRCAKSASTARSWSSVTVHGPVPAQPAAFQPVNDEWPSGAAVKVTAVPTGAVSEHAPPPPHSIPLGSEATAPEPPP